MKKKLQIVYCIGLIAIVFGVLYCLITPSHQEIMRAKMIWGDIYYLPNSNRLSFMKKSSVSSKEIASLLEAMGGRLNETRNDLFLLSDGLGKSSYWVSNVDGNLFYMSLPFEINKATYRFLASEGNTIIRIVKDNQLQTGKDLKNAIESNHWPIIDNRDLYRLGIWLKVLKM